MFPNGWTYEENRNRQKSNCLLAQAACFDGYSLVYEIVFGISFYKPERICPWRRRRTFRTHPSCSCRQPQCHGSNVVKQLVRPGNFYDNYEHSAHNCGILRAWQKFAACTTVCVLLFSGMMYLLSAVGCPQFIANGDYGLMLIAAIAGGACAGVSMGFMLRQDLSIGGTDIIGKSSTLTIRQLTLNGGSLHAIAALRWFQVSWVFQKSTVQLTQRRYWRVCFLPYCSRSSLCLRNPKYAIWLNRACSRPWFHNHHGQVGRNRARVVNSTP